MEPQRSSPEPKQPNTFVPESQRELPSTHAPKTRWIAIAIITALWHLFLFWFASDIRPPAPRERTVINTIDPAKLETMRRQQRSFLLSKDKTPAEKTPENKDARYDSDRNRRVEREQRAARTDVMPQPRGGGAKTEGQAAKPRQAQNPAPHLDLSNLGALSNITQPRPPAEQAERAPGGNAGPAGNGADQAILEDNLPTGAENMLNTRESVYYTFYARIYETIGPLWQSKIREMARRDVPPGTYATQVEVVLDADGNYVEARYLRKSGIEEFDRSVTDAWARVPRFPNPPKDLIGPDGFVRMGWTFLVQVDSGMGWNYAPPSRTY